MPNGTGDLLARLEAEGVLEELEKDRCEYVSVVSSTNLVEQMVDCMTVGYVVGRGLEVGLKVVGGREGEEYTRVLELNNRPYVIDPKEFSYYQTFSDHNDKQYN